MAIIFDLFENSVKDGIVASKLHVKRWGDYPLKSGSDTRKMYRSPGGCDCRHYSLERWTLWESEQRVCRTFGQHRLFHLSLKSTSDIKPKYVKDDDVQVSSIKFISDKDLIERFQTMYLECKVDKEEVKQKLAECFKTYSF